MTVGIFIRMDKHQISIYILAFPVLVICGVKIFFAVDLNTCFGLAHIIRDFIINFLVLSVALIFSVINLYKIFTVNPQRVLRVFITAMIALCIIVTFQVDWKSMRFKNTILKASIENSSLHHGKITLLNDEEYLVEYGHIDWSCSFTGTYSISQDTLKLDGNPSEKTDSIILDSYIIDDTHLIPLVATKKDTMANSVMRIF